MTCAEWKEQVYAYAIGALDPAERAAFEAHLAEATRHEGCEEALRRANEAAAAIGMTLPPMRPAPETWAAIEARLGEAARPSRDLFSMLGWAVAAAAILLVVFFVRERGQAQGELAAARAQRDADGQARARCASDLEHARADAKLQRDALQLLERAGTRLIALAPQPGASSTANVLYHPGDKLAYLVGKGLAAPSGKDYELWLIRGDQKIPAGLLRGDGDGAGALVAAIDPRLLAAGPPDAIAITLEPAGGGEQPRGSLVLVGKI